MRVQRRIVGLALVSHRCKFAQQRRKFEFTEKFAQRCKIGPGQFQIFENKWYRHVCRDRCKLFAEFYEFAVLFERLAIICPLHFARVLQRLLGAAVLLNQLPCAHFANSGFPPLAGRRLFVGIARAGNVVDRVAHQRHHVGNLARRHSHQLFHFLRVDQQVALGRVQHLHAPAHQLHQVLVAGDDVNIEIFFLGLLGERPDHVVGLIPGVLDHRQPHCLAIAPDKRQLQREFIGHGLPLRLVFSKKFVAKSRRRDVEHHSYVVRLPILEQLANHVCKDVGNVRRNAGRSSHAHGHRGVESAKDVAHRVNQEQAFWGFCRHSVRILCHSHVQRLQWQAANRPV